jgi:hypothetical protein
MFDYMQVGLVDELGGVNRAVELAKELAGLPQDPQATVTVEWPSRWGTSQAAGVLHMLIVDREPSWGNLSRREVHVQHQLNGRSTGCLACLSPCKLGGVFAAVSGCDCWFWHPPSTHRHATRGCSRTSKH